MAPPNPARAGATAALSADRRARYLPAEVAALMPVGAERRGIDSQHFQLMLGQQAHYVVLGDAVHLKVL